MGKQPYIPLYIGDWEQDTNCLSLEAEGAWLKLVFKLWKGESNLGKGLLSISFRAMSILFKCSPERTRDIFQELVESNVFDHEILPNGDVKIRSRRLIREAELSKIRSETGKTGGRPKSGNQTKTKKKAKPNQNPDNESDNEAAPKNVKERVLSVLNEGLGEHQQEMEALSMKYGRVLDYQQELRDFRDKIALAPEEYIAHTAGGFRLAFDYQLRNASKRSNNGTHNKQGSAPSRKEQQNINLVRDFAVRYGLSDAGGPGPGVPPDERGA